jgi:hypothetical protein
MSNPTNPTNPPTFGRPTGLPTNPPKPTSGQPNPFNRPATLPTAPAQQPAGGSLTNRLNSNRTTMNWTVKAYSKVAVRFDLRGLGDPFHRLLHTDLNLEYGDVAQVSKRLADDSDVHQQLSQLLDKAWASYGLKGAILLYPSNDSVKKAYTQVVLPQPLPQPKADGDDEEEFTTSNAPQPVKFVKPTCLRAIDLLLVMNVLARARAFILANDTGLALESGFLQESYICDDPRLVRLAQATGTIEESWG